MHDVAKKKKKKANVAGKDLGRGSAENASFFSCIGFVFPELPCSLLEVKRKSSIHRVVVNRHNVDGCE